MNLHPRAQVTQPTDPSYRLIPLTYGQCAIVDTEDYEDLNRFIWQAIWTKTTRSYYVMRAIKVDGKNACIHMSRAITNAPNDMQVDHRDHNTLNHRRSNLRVATCQQNNCNKRRRIDNKSGLKGVSWRSSHAQWEAQIQSHGKKKWLGFFPTPELASEAYRAAALELHGEFSCF